MSNFLPALFIGLTTAWTSALDDAPKRNPASDRTEINFETVAKEFLASHDLAAVAPDRIVFDDVVNAHSVRGVFGLYEVCFPATGLEKHAEELKLCAAALLDAQDLWLDWLKPAGKDQKALREDLRTISSWVKGWKTSTLQKAKDAGGKDLSAILAAPQNVVDALARVAANAGKAEALGAAREPVASARLLLMPTRKDFGEWVAFAGLVTRDLRNSLWLDSAADWTQCYVIEDQVIALEYTVPNRKPGDYTSGVGMNQRDPTVMQQQVVQLAMNSMLERYYEGRVPAAFAAGLSMNLVIDQFGEVNTRVDGDVRSKVTGNREVFVAGGRSEGGELSVNSAETRWREDHGKDHFLRILRQAQKDGEDLDKKSKNKSSCFGLVSDSGSEKAPACGPFLGSAAISNSPPEAKFMGDFAEFLRAYKSGFIFWLQNKAAGNEKTSREKFAQLLSRLADPSLLSDFETIFTDLYDKSPLSGPDANKDTLEGKFLLWLQKQK